MNCPYCKSEIKDSGLFWKCIKCRIVIEHDGTEYEIPENLNKKDHYSDDDG